jgi:hypothetical protein
VQWQGACAEPRPTTGSWRSVSPQAEGGPGQDERATTPSGEQHVAKPILLRPDYASHCGPHHCPLTARPPIAVILGRLLSLPTSQPVRSALVRPSIPGEIFRQKPKTAPSCSTYSVEGATASRTIGFSRILRPCSGRLLRVLRSPGALSAGEQTHGTDGSTLSWRVALLLSRQSGRRAAREDARIVPSDADIRLVACDVDARSLVPQHRF